MVYQFRTFQFNIILEQKILNSKIFFLFYIHKLCVELCVNIQVHMLEEEYLKFEKVACNKGINTLCRIFHVFYNYQIIYDHNRIEVII